MGIANDDDVLKRIDLVGEHLQRQDVQIGEVRHEQATVRQELTAVTVKVEENFKSLNARLLPLEHIATTLDKLESLIRWALRIIGAAVLGEVAKLVIDHIHIRFP